MSTLHVENLKGLSSGANANKIIVPSGQTIDASAGTLVPSAGALVQVAHNTHGTFDSTSSSYVDVVSVTFTPKYNNSRIFIRYNGHLYKYNADNYPDSNSKIITDQGTGSYIDLVVHPYITYMDTTNYMYTLSMAAQYQVANTNAQTVVMQILPRGHRTYIYSGSNLFTVEEIKQ